MWLSHEIFLLLQILAGPCPQEGSILLSISSVFVVICRSKNSIHYGVQRKVHLEPSRIFTIELLF